MRFSSFVWKDSRGAENLGVKFDGEDLTEAATEATGGYDKQSD